jgi:hypothetical protein
LGRKDQGTSNRNLGAFINNSPSLAKPKSSINMNKGSISQREVKILTVSKSLDRKKKKPFSKGTKKIKP